VRGPDQPVRSLSGGNQQKVALGRLLHRDVDVLLLDEPTRGIDVGEPRADLRDLADELAAKGKAILLVSSHLPELLGVCDRVAVMRRGALGAAASARHELDERALLPRPARERRMAARARSSRAARGSGRSSRSSAVYVLFAVARRPTPSARPSRWRPWRARRCRGAARGRHDAGDRAGGHRPLGRLVVALVTVVDGARGAGAGPLAAALAGIARACGRRDQRRARGGAAITPFIVTLGTMSGLRGAAKGLADEQKIDADPGPREAHDEPGGERLIFPPGVFIALALASVAVLLAYTRFGRTSSRWARTSAPRASRVCSVGRVTVSTYALAGLMAGVAGVMEFSTLTVGDPTDSHRPRARGDRGGRDRRRLALGGRGSIAGALLGALLMTVIRTGCHPRRLPNWVQEILTGAIIVIAVTLDRWRGLGE
jgi:ribose/xylose/arabinose/galactoside ABC-type transport system permease subunit